MTVRAMLRQAWLVLLITAVCAGAAAGYTKLQHPVYRASMKIVVGQADSFFQPDVANATETYTQTLSDLLKSDLIARTVVDRLQLEVEPTDLTDNLLVTTQPSAAVLDVSYDDTDRARGLRTLDAVGSVFIETVHDRLAATSIQQGKPPLTVTVFDPAHVTPGVVRPKPLLNLAGATALGLVLGILAAMLRVRRTRPTVRQLPQLERQVSRSPSA